MINRLVHDNPWDSASLTNSVDIKALAGNMRSAGTCGQRAIPNLGKNTISHYNVKQQQKTHDFGCSPILSQFWPHLGYRSRLLIVKWTHLFHNNAHIIIIYIYIYTQTLYFWTLPPRTMPMDWQWIVKNNIGTHLVRSSSRSGQPKSPEIV